MLDEECAAETVHTNLAEGIVDLRQQLFRERDRKVRRPWMILDVGLAKSILGIPCTAKTQNGEIPCHEKGGLGVHKGIGLCLAVRAQNVLEFWHGFQGFHLDLGLKSIITKSHKLANHREIHGK